MYASENVPPNMSSKTPSSRKKGKNPHLARALGGKKPKKSVTPDMTATAPSSSTVSPAHESASHKNRRLPPDKVAILKEWYDEHYPSAFPTEAQKLNFTKETGFSLTQVNYWFINARRRYKPSSEDDSLPSKATSSKRKWGVSSDDHKTMLQDRLCTPASPVLQLPLYNSESERREWKQISEQIISETVMKLKELGHDEVHYNLFLLDSVGQFKEFMSAQKD